jgi:4-amino-4-deoxy-L-arabinose transferase-like glycosyltransferase
VRTIPVAGWVCAAVAILNAVSWSLITPPFQVPDEPSHIAYVKQVAEALALPSSNSFEFSPEEDRVLSVLHERSGPILPPTGTISSVAQQRRLERELALAAELPREGSHGVGTVVSEPPLYYLLETIPYAVGSGATLLARVALMRLLSALFAGVTAMFVFLFVRETSPATRAAWVAGGLSIAFAPLLGYMSGAVNSDSVLFAISAALFWSLARAFRRGLTYRSAAIIGGVTAVGLLSKASFVGLFPGIIVALGVLARRMARSSRSSAYRAFGLGAGIAAIPIVPFLIISLTTSRSPFAAVSAPGTVASQHGSIFAAISYVWELFLPRLPGMTAYFPGVFTTRQIWFDGFVGQYGWSETAFPEWVYTVAAIFGVAVLMACARTLIALRKTVRERLAELVVYLIMSLGLLTLIGGASYFAVELQAFTEARFLLPLLALIAAGLGLAIRAAGRRSEAVLGTVLVLAVLADNIFSQLLVVARYYG